MFRTNIKKQSFLCAKKISKQYQNWEASLTYNKVTWNRGFKIAQFLETLLSVFRTNTKRLLQCCLGTVSPQVTRDTQKWSWVSAVQYWMPEQQDGSSNKNLSPPKRPLGTLANQCHSHAHHIQGRSPLQKEDSLEGINPSVLYLIKPTAYITRWESPYDISYSMSGSFSWFHLKSYICILYAVTQEHLYLVRFY